MSKVILTITPNPCIDRMVVVNDLKKGKDCSFHEEYISAGGKGLNVSRALYRLGVPSIATGILAGKKGQWVEDLFKEESLSPDFFFASQGQTRMNVTIIDKKKDQTTRILSKGPKISKKDADAFTQKYEKLIPRSSMVVLSGRNAYGISDRYYKEWILLAQRAHIPCCLDASGGCLLEGLKASPFLVKPNLQEAEDLFQKKINSKERIKQALSFFHQYGVKMVLLSLGEKGVIGSYKNHILKIVPSRIKRYHDVGCGDSLLAGFLASYIKTHCFKRSLLCAVALASSQAMDYCPGSLDLKLYKSVLRKLIVEDL